jgi:HD-GYP domain-containing protein (c-di-GMP phosphodiesterase class II)
MQPRDRRNLLSAYMLAVAGVAAILIPFCVARSTAFNARGAVTFGILFLLAELAPVSVRYSSYSISYVIGVAALVSFGPVVAAIAASFGAFDRRVLKERKSFGVTRLLFNAAQLSLTTLISGAVYVYAHGPVGHLRSTDFPSVLIALLFSALVHFAFNTGLVTIAISLAHSVTVREAWHANYSSMLGTQLAYSVVGLLAGNLYIEIGVVAVGLLIVPLMVARRAMTVAADLNRAYDSTLRALVTAIEAKDAYTRGHAERVSELASITAAELGLSPQNVRALRIAALLHDVGKLAVSTAVLTKPGKLTDEEYEHMKGHPIHGCEVISDIDFLRSGEALNAVRHHHERMDGRGYPDGLKGDDLPLTARIVMVADAFDSMTSTRTYRLAKSIESAMRELRRCSATQFDPAVIAALSRAIEKYGWKPTPEAVAQENHELVGTGAG